MSVVASDLVRLSSVDGEAIGGLRQRSFALRRSLAEACTAASDGWSRPSALDRPVHAELSGEGVFVSGRAADLMREAFLAGTPRGFVLTVPGEGAWRGDFLVKTLTWGARTGGEVSFKLTLVSSGPVRFQPEAS